MRQVETLESRMLLSASPVLAALSTTVVMSPLTSYQLVHGALQIKATGNLYAKVASVTKVGDVEVELADDTGAAPTCTAFPASRFSNRARVVRPSTGRQTASTPAS